MRFLLVDRILRLEPGRMAEAEKSLPISEELFRDHFPGFPVVPGVLLIEMMGQTAAKALNVQKLPRGNAMLGEVRNARFRQWVKPGEVIRLSAEIAKNQEDFAIAKCQAVVGGKKVGSAELLFFFAPLGQFAPDYRDEILEDFLQRV
ncbi:MAG TPA: 3-hydroxyacyl-ACP dehydratase FabZ family protein [Candidatus Competibacter sp.]|nr:3-hydroxyacyl-ACP dehydratase FabZ family protein [Candidatus Competibacter sp.]